MGIQDRDYYHEKRDDDESLYSHQAKQAVNAAPQRLWKTLLKNILAWCLVSLALFAIFNHSWPLNQNRLQPANIKFNPVRILQNCEPLPSHGAVHLYDPAAMRRTDVLYSGLEIRNNYNYPMVALLTDAASDRRLLAASVTSIDPLQISVPVGQYGMQMLVGSEWCNLERGFTDGATVSVSGGIAVNPGSTTFMQFDGEGLQPLRLALAYRIATPEPFQPREQLLEIIDSGQLELRQAQNGHYFSSGTINGAPVVFMIDTGATLVSISAEVAARANIQECNSRVVSTANGKVNACLTTVPELTFGSFKFTGVDVIVMPGMTDGALLGMNVLRNFRIEQADGILRLSSQ